MRKVVETFGADIGSAARDERRLVLGTETEAIVIGRSGRSVSPRLAWDGVADLKLEGDRLIGQGFDVLTDEWRPIELDLASQFQVVRPPRGWRTRLRAALRSLLSRRRARTP